MRNVNERPSHWMPRKGDRVDYHSLIGGPVTSSDHVVRAVETSHSGYAVAWLTNKAGCVAADAPHTGERKAGYNVSSLRVGCSTAFYVDLWAPASLCL